MIKETLRNDKRLTEAAIERFLPETELPQGLCAAAMKYSLEAGGKRIRPVLVLEFCRACGGDINSALPVAAAVEMIHTFSLIHDDLPCMDNDDMRRGRPSCHKQFDEVTALLAGDALAVLPFEVISRYAGEYGLSADRALRIIAELSYQTGVYGMIGGQQIDTENEGKKLSGELLMKMYSLKTSALLKAACKCGCIAAGADEETIKSAELYGEKLGLAFQLVDDILDVTGDEKLLGKPIGSDAEQGKLTYVGIYGLEKAKAAAQNLTGEALKALGAFKENGFLTELTELLLNRNS